MNKVQLDYFKQELDRICRSYGVWMRKISEREDRPGDNCYFCEIEISAKIIKEHDEIKK